MRQIYFIILLFITLFLSACGTTAPTDPVDMYKDKQEAQIFKDGERAMLKKDYQEAVSHFEAINARYPFGKYARQAHLDSIYSYYKQDDTPSALALADRYIHLYPRGPFVDYAYYMRGLIEFDENQGFFEKYFPVDLAKRDLSSMRKAYRSFDQVVRFHLDSPYWLDARQRMVYIRNLFARQEYLVAQFYLENEMYVAVVNRANDIVQHYQESSSVPDALVVMVKAYRHLNLNREANDAIETLKLNFGCAKTKKLLNEKVEGCD